MKVLRHPDEWARGAIGLRDEDVEEGLLFLLPRVDCWPITMAGVNIPLDVYWLSPSGLVLEHAELYPGLPDYYPEAQAAYVLELTMRETPRYRVGDYVELPV